jgi:CBS domain-containing protein
MACLQDASSGVQEVAVMTKECAGKCSATLPSLTESVAPFLRWLETPLAELMIRHPIAADELDSVGMVQARMMHSGAGHLPVLSGNRPIGLVTAHDLAGSMMVSLPHLRRAELDRLLELPVTEVMSKPPITLPSHATLEAAVQKMVEAKVGSIIVVDPDDGRLLGLVTRSTITRLLAARSEVSS